MTQSCPTTAKSCFRTSFPPKQHVLPRVSVASSTRFDYNTDLTSRRGAGMPVSSTSVLKTHRLSHSPSFIAPDDKKKKTKATIFASSILIMLARSDIPADRGRSCLNSSEMSVFEKNVPSSDKNGGEAHKQPPHTNCGT